MYHSTSRGIERDIYALRVAISVCKIYAWVADGKFSKGKHRVVKSERHSGTVQFYKSSECYATESTNIL